MKKSLFFAVAATVLSGCASDELVDVSVPNTGTSHSDIRFTTSQKNTTRAQKLNEAGHYNFGVFGYKSTDKVNNIMADYLVGYYDVANGYGTQTGYTFGDQEGNLDGQSYWMYEGMGSAEYNGTYAGETVNPGTTFASNVANQYLRYWDNAADYTCFYAYAPYVNNTATGKTVTYVDGQAVGTSTDKYVLTIPNGTIKHGYDKADELEFMYAWTKVTKSNYGHDVALNFNRLNAKVNIKFWEDIPGYSVRIIDLNSTYSVSAVPAIKKEGEGNYGYKLGKIYSENGAKIQFYPEATTATDPTLKQYEGTTVSTPIKFNAPTAAQIGESRVDATPSATTYYAIPKGSADDVLKDGADTYADTKAVDADLALTGLTFHVSYELISTTGEVITVKDATVFVPKEYVNWKTNTHYTYIFKITKDSNGTTDNTIDPKPEDPEVPTEPSLYPIVFDNCTVVDWKENVTEWEITDTETLSYHNVVLDKYSVTNGAATDITITITNDDKDLVHPVDMNNVVVKDPSGSVVATSVYTPGESTIHVPANAASGVYTVTYTCPTADVYANHPKTWTANFVVGNVYTLTTNLDEVGTHGLAASALSISATKDGATYTPAVADLSIEYPINLSDAEKALVTVSTDGTKVEVAATAVPGKYKLICTNNYVTEGGVVVPAKVAEKVFEVKDYQFILSTYAVGLGASPVVINATCPGTGVLSMTAATGITVDDAAKTISVANTAAEGTYTVTYTVQGSTVSEVQYQKTFTVANTYAVSLNKTVLQRDLGRANEAAQGTDAITITTLKNGEASTGETAKLKVKLGATDVTSNFTIVCVQAGDPAADTNTYTLKVNKEADVNVVYTVEYTGQAGKVVTADFTVQK